MSAAEVAAGARSWLFALGDSDHKMNRALGSAADIVITYLEDTVAETEKTAARERAAEFLKANAGQRDRFWVRINPIQGPHALRDLAKIVSVAPGGLMLPKPPWKGRRRAAGPFSHCAGNLGWDRAWLDEVMIVATETPQARFAADSYGGVPHLAAMTWGAEDIGTAGRSATGSMTLATTSPTSSPGACA